MDVTPGELARELACAAIDILYSAWPPAGRGLRWLLCRLGQHDPWCRGRRDHDRVTGKRSR